jgi:hypothetical protein
VDNILILISNRGNGLHYVAPDLPAWPFVRIHTGLHYTDSHFSAVLKVLFPDTILATMESPIITPHHEAQHNSKGKKLSPKLYDSILTHVNMIWPNTSFHHHNNLPHPPNAHILPPIAVPTTHITHKGCSYSTFSMHSGGSSLSYLCRDGTVDAGFIVSMWT